MVLLSKNVCLFFPSFLESVYRSRFKHVITFKDQYLAVQIILIQNRRVLVFYVIHAFLFNVYLGLSFKNFQKTSPNMKFFISSERDETYTYLPKE
jgi:hypothetical protein